MLEVAGQIAHMVAVPVSADLEAAYALTPSDVADTVGLAIAAGVAGMNLEDGISDIGRPSATADASGMLYSVEAAIERVAAARAGADASGVDLVINARTDVFLLGVGAPEDRLAHAVRRARAYRAAGADCLFVPGVRDAETIGALARAIDGPLNVLAGPGTPSVAELAALGVARISTGSAPMRMALACAARACRDALERGVLDVVMDASLAFAEVDALMTKAASEQR
jgi:2-methylisocitrate lyase-like PEP mutase family enzyme